MYEAGVDVIYHAAGGSGARPVRAAAEVGEPGEVWAIGVDSDQYLTASPELQAYILTSMLKRVDVAIYETIKAVREVASPRRRARFDLKRRRRRLLDLGRLLDDIDDKLEAFKAEIISGEIVVPTAP